MQAKEATMEVGTTTEEGEEDVAVGEDGDAETTAVGYKTRANLTFNPLINSSKQHNSS